MYTLKELLASDKLPEYYRKLSAPAVSLASWAKRHGVRKQKDGRAYVYVFEEYHIAMMEKEHVKLSHQDHKRIAALYSDGVRRPHVVRKFRKV